MNPYEDIIHLPHPTSKKHPRMPRAARAVQFSSFAALSGHDEAIRETGRLTEKKREPDETEKNRLDQQLMQLEEMQEERGDIEIRMTYFLPDEKKEGGRVVTEKVTVHQIDFCTRAFVLSDHRRIEVEQILDFYPTEDESADMQEAD